MAKKIRYVKRIKEKPNTDLKDYGGKDNENPTPVISEEIREMLSAMSDSLISRFFSEKLSITEVNDFISAMVVVEERFNEPKKAEFFYKELLDFLDMNKESGKESENDGKATTEKDEVPEEPQDELPEPEPEPEPFNLPSEEDFENFQEYTKQSLEAVKIKLQEELDRLTVCEVRLDEHDEDIRKNNTDVLGMKDDIGQTFEKFETLVNKIVEKKFSEGGTSAPASSSFEVKYTGGNKPTKKIKGIVPKEFKRILQLAQSRKNIMLVGPSGCGKSFVCPMVAEALGLRYANMSCVESMDEDIFQGMLLPTGEGMRMEHWASKFVDTYENGGLFLIDEMDLADGNLLAFANNALSNDHFYLPKRLHNPLVKRHPDFVVIAASNTFGHGGDMIYSARNQLDGTTLDRFRSGMVYMDYDEKVETAIVDKEVYEWGKWIRKAINSLKLQRLMTTRVMKDFTDLKEDHGWGVKDWEQSYFLDWEKDDVTRVKNWIIKELTNMKQKLENKM